MSSLLNFSSLTADTTIYYILYFIYLLLIKTASGHWTINGPFVCLLTSAPKFPRNRVFSRARKRSTKRSSTCWLADFSFDSRDELELEEIARSAHRNEILSLSFDSTSSPTSFPTFRAKSYMWVIGR